MSNPKRRESDGSLIADLRRRVSWLEQRRTPAGAKKLDDLSDVAVPTPAMNDVLTFTGAQWVNAPSVAGDIAVTEALASYEDDGIFSEASYFNFNPQFAVAPNSFQLVIVTATVAASDTSLVVDGVPGTSYGDVTVGVPTPWRVYAYDSTGDPGYTRIYASMGVGSGYVCFPMWLHNDTDDEAEHVVYILAEPMTTAYEFDATVEVRAESVFQMAALTP